MSTILDALRKVERERESGDVPLDAPVRSPEARRRSKWPLGAIAACALAGFAGGALLSWWLPAGPEVEEVAFPVSPPPPAIAVPRPPLEAKKVAPPVPVSDAVAQAPAAPPASADAPPAPVAPAAETSQVAELPAAPPPPVAAEAPVDLAGKNLVASLDPNASALEPSPFAPARDPGKEAVAQGASKPPPPPAASSPLTEDRVPMDVAALPAPAPAVPDLPTAAEVEPEAPLVEETPAETVVDTGRSPPGAPKVALSFLQWSADPTRRFAFISIDGAPTQRVREGEVTAGLTVAAITPTGVRFKREGTIFVIRPRH